MPTSAHILDFENNKCRFQYPPGTRGKPTRGFQKTGIREFEANATSYFLPIASISASFSLRVDSAIPSVFAVWVWFPFNLLYTAVI